MEKFSIQIISDMHLEFQPGKYPRIIPTAPNIALCGDIGIPTQDNFGQFLSYLARTFRRVFLVPGNHEYYSSEYTHDQIGVLLRRICALWSNVYLLDNSSIVIDGLTIIGSTLWSHIPNHLFQFYQKRINNFSKIHKMSNVKNRGVCITPRDTNRWYGEAVRFLAREIKKAKKCIVLTHYPPFYDGKNSGHSKGVELAYYNHLPFLISSKVLAWAYGHTHEPISYVLNGTIIVSNPRGYEWEKIKFDSTLRLELNIPLNHDSIFKITHPTVVPIEC